MVKVLKDFIKKYALIPMGVKSAFFFSVSSMLVKGINIISIPIFTRMLTTEEMGYVDLYNTWYSNFSIITGLGLSSGGLALALKKYENNRDEYISSILSLSIFMCVILGGLVIFLRDNVEAIFGFSAAVMFLMVPALAANFAIDIWVYRLKYEYNYIISSIFSLSYAILTTISGIIIIAQLRRIGCNKVALGRIVSSNIITIIAGFSIIFFVYRKGKKVVAIDYWVFSLKLSIPLIGYSLADQVLTSSDRIMISQICGNSVVGIYSLLYKTSSLTAIIWNSVMAAFVPFIYDNFNEKKKEIRRISNMILALYMVVLIALIYAGPEIVGVFATKVYYDGIDVIPPVAGGMFFMAIFSMYSPVFVYYKKTQWLMFPTAVTAVLNIILNFFFINRFGYKAAAYTTLSSYIILCIFGFVFVKRIELDNGNKTYIYDFVTILILSGIMLICCITGRMIYQFVYVRYVLLMLLAVFLSIMVKRLYEEFITMKKQKR